MVPEQADEQVELAVEERLGAAFRGIVEADGADLERSGRLEPLAHNLAEQGRRLLPEISCLITTISAARQDSFYCQAGSGPFAESVVNRSFSRRGTVMDLAIVENRPTLKISDSFDAASDVTSTGSDMTSTGGYTTSQSIPHRFSVQVREKSDIAMRC